jgi:amino acid adenylation domain-containing protein
MPIDPRTVHALFSAQARRTPDAIAVICDGDQLTYGELERRANRLGHALVERGLGIGSRVAVSLPRSLDLVTALLGILKAGAAYLPLPTVIQPNGARYPIDRLRFMLDDAAVPLVITDAAGRESFLPRPVLELEAARDELAARSEDPPAVAATSEEIAYVMYTSGSTGLPKGVCVPHRGIIRLVCEPDYVTFTPDDVFLQVTPVTFDPLGLELWGTLLNGARLVIAPAGVAGLDALGTLLVQHRVSLLILTPSQFNQMIDENPAPLRGVRQLISGGDAASAAHWRKALDRLPDTTVINCYGPTENTVVTTAWRCVPEVVRSGVVPIGRAINGTTVHVLDAGLQPVAPGEVGELVTGGSGVALGYLNRPELNAERFVPDRERPGALWYRTGDLVRALPDGSLLFVGRNDTQVKVRGFRIELGEIETALREHEAVRDAVVMAREDTPGDKRLVAYVIPADPAKGLAELSAELRSFAVGRLPEYMVPAAFVALPSFPLTANAKVDRAALPPPGRARPALRTKYVEPRTGLERFIAGLFCEALSLAQVGIDDDFFELGGDSLRAAACVARLHAPLGVAVPVSVMFKGATVSELVALLRARWPAAVDHAFGGPAGDEQPEEALPPIERTKRTGALPLSFSEQLFYHQPHPITFNLVSRLDGPLSVEGLEQAFTDLVARHDTLRTVYPRTPNGPVRAIAEPAPFRLPFVEVAGGDEGERQANALLREEVARPYDLAAGPLWRVLLVRLGPERHRLLTAMHHLISDGESLVILFRDLSARYAARIGAPHAPLPELPARYADFACWQDDNLRAGRLAEDVAFWKHQLKRAVRLPTDRPRPPQLYFPTAHQIDSLPAAFVQSLRELARTERSTLTVLLLAPFHVALARLLGLDRTIVPMVYGNRQRAETKNLVGAFANYWALEADFAGNPTFRELLGLIKKSLTLALERTPEYPALEVLTPDAAGHIGMPVDVVFNMNVSLPVLELPGIAASSYREVPTLRSAITLHFILEEQRDGSVALVWQYNRELLDEATITRLRLLYRQLLDDLPGRLDSRVDNSGNPLGA